MNHPEYFFYGAAGAGALELMKLYEYRAKLHLKRFRKLVRSKMFWGTVFGMLVASGFIAWAANVDADSVRVWQVVVMGIAARSIVRDLGAVTSASQRSQIQLGEQDNRVRVRDVFQ